MLQAQPSSPPLTLTLLVSHAQAACCKVKCLPHSELCLVLIHLADVGTGARYLEGIKALAIVLDVTTNLRGQTQWSNFMATDVIIML